MHSGEFVIQMLVNVGEVQEMTLHSESSMFHIWTATSPPMVLICTSTVGFADSLRVQINKALNSLYFRNSFAVCPLCRVGSVSGTRQRYDFVR